MKMKIWNKKISGLLLLLNISIIFSSLCSGFLMAAPAMAKEMSSAEQITDVICQHAAAADDTRLNRAQEIMPCCYQKNDNNKEAGLAYQSELTRLQAAIITDSNPVTDNSKDDLNLSFLSSPPPEQALLESVVKKE